MGATTVVNAVNDAPAASDADDSAAPKPKGRSSSLLVATGILFSRISGLVREFIFGAFFAIGATSDAFGLATRIPNVLQMLLGEGTLSAAFIPVYSSEVEQDEEEAGRIAGAVFSLLLLVAAALVIIGVVAARPIVWVFARNWTNDAQIDLAVTLLRIIFPSAGLLVMSAWCLGILNSHRRFFLSYVAPVLWNVAQIAAVVVAALLLGVGDFDGELDALQDIDTNVEVLGGLARVAAWGFFAGSALQFLVQLPLVRQLVTHLKITLDLSRKGVRTILRRFSGVVVGRGVIQISAIVDLILAGALTIGAVTALAKAQVLFIMPISLFAVSIAASELPELSRMTEDGPLRDRAQAGFSRIAFFTAFTALAYILAGDKIVGALFEYGRFTSDDTLLIWWVLGAYSVGLVPSALSRLTQNVIWARGDTAGPARVSMVRVATSIIVAVLIMGLFDRLGTTDIRDRVPTLYDGGVKKEALRFGAMGITLGSAVGGWVEAILLWRMADRAVAGISPLRTVRPLLPALLATAITILALRVVTDDWWPLLGAAVTVGFGGVIYIGVLWAMRVPQANLVFIGPLRKLRRN